MSAVAAPGPRLGPTAIDEIEIAGVAEDDADDPDHPRPVVVAHHEHVRRRRHLDLWSSTMTIRGSAAVPAAGERARPPRGPPSAA